MPGRVVDFLDMTKKKRQPEKLPLFVNYKTVCSPFLACAFALFL